MLTFVIGWAVGSLVTLLTLAMFEGGKDDARP